LQNLLDALKFSVEQISANSSHPEKTIKARKLIEYLLIDINEYSIARYGTVPRHVHGQAVADPFAGDDLYGVDMSLLTHERVEKAKKQVAKDRANATLAAAARGVSAGGKKKSGGRGRGGKHQQQQQQRQPYNNSQHLGGMGRGGGGGNGGATGGGYWWCHQRIPCPGVLRLRCFRAHSMQLPEQQVVFGLGTHSFFFAWVFLR